MKFLLFCVVLCYVVLCTKGNTVKVSVYYETLCPDSIDFIRKQLYSNYELFGRDLIQLELIPYGFAKEIDKNGTKSFTCQHGVLECHGNMIHGIVINSKPIWDSVKFVFCSERTNHPSADQILETCANEIGISWDFIQKILSSGKGADIMSENGKKTKKLGPNFIPTVVFDDRYNQEDANKALSDFKGVVCKYLNYEPDQCNPKKNNVGVIQL